MGTVDAIILGTWVLMTLLIIPAWMCASYLSQIKDKLGATDKLPKDALEGVPMEQRPS